MISRVKEKGIQIKYHSLIHLIVKHHFLKKEFGKEKWLKFLSSPIKKIKKGPMTKRVKIEKGELSQIKTKREIGESRLVEGDTSNKKRKLETDSSPKPQELP